MKENGEILLYQTSSGEVRVEVRFEEETFWMSQKTMAELFQVVVPTINYHLKEIFSSDELDKASVIRNFLTTANDGKQYKVNHYNLDAIIAVGYRVNSKQATQFRKWATQILKEYIIKGFVLNDEMMMNGRPFGQDYFDELLERIREIRASERRFYQKITDIYAQCSYDYNVDDNLTREFFQSVQNKLLYAVAKQTAPEIIHSRANSLHENMGLTSWKNAPKGKILKSDVTISKNHLTKDEISELNHIVNMYLDYAENQAKRKKLMSMKDWSDKLQAFLSFNDYELLPNLGRISREVANQTAESEYSRFRIIQDREHTSDFDRLTEQLDKKELDE